MHELKTRIDKTIRVLMCIILYFIGLGIFLYICHSQLHIYRNYIRLFGGIIFLFLPVLFCLRIIKKHIAVFFSIMIIINTAYGFAYYKSFIRDYVANKELINTQSFWYSASNQLNRDVLFYTLLHDKTVVVPSDECWYYRFCEMFAGNTIVDRSLPSIIEEDYSQFYSVGSIRMRTLRDLMDDQTFKILDDRVNNRDYQSLYIDVDGFEGADTITVIADDDYNIYMKDYSYDH